MLPTTPHQNKIKQEIGIGISRTPGNECGNEQNLWETNLLEIRGALCHSQIMTQHCWM
jgi:hypothetical protein